METKAETYKRLKNALDENAGYRYLIRMSLHERSLHIFGGNFADLIQILNLVENPNNIPKVWAEDKRKDQIFFHREISRHFHNFLAAALSLVSHTRIFMQDAHENQLIYLRYSQKVTESFANDTLAHFVQDLRNYFLHKGIPASKMQLLITVDSGTLPISQVLLETPELLKWKRWSQKGREYLYKCENEFPLLEVAEKYHRKVVNFYKWFKREMDDLHKEELEIYEELRKEIADFNKFSH